MLAEISFATTRPAQSSNGNISVAFRAFCCPFEIIRAWASATESKLIHHSEINSKIDISFYSAASGALYVPDLPPVFSSKRTPEKTMPLSIAFAIS